MTGILGVLRAAADMAADIHGLLPLAREMAHRGGMDIQRSEDGLACLAGFSRDRAWTPEPRAWPCRIESIPVVLDGRLDNRDELWRLLGDDREGVDRCDDLALLRGLYRKRGVSALALLKGDYAVALYDGSGQTLHLACDIIGVRPLSFIAAPHGSVFATDNKAILAHPGMARRPNNAALAELLVGAGTGAHARGETLFEGIAAVQRGQLVSVRGGQVARSSVKDFDLSPHPEARSHDSLRDEFRALFIQSVGRRMDAQRPTAITVSGGLDSSSIYCVARWLVAAQHRADEPIGMNFTAMDGSWADEREFTTAIMRQYPGELVRVPIEPNGCLAVARDLTWHSESVLLDPMGSLNARIYAEAAARGGRTFLTGYWGDDMFLPHNYWYHLLWSLKPLEFRRQIREHHRWNIESPATPAESMHEVLRGSVRYALPERAIAGVRRWAGRRRNADGLHSGRLGVYRGVRARAPKTFAPGKRMMRWKLEMLGHAGFGHYLNWLNRAAAQYGLTPAYPFLDEDLVQWWLRCVGSELHPGGVSKGLLRDAMRGIVPDRVLDRRSKGDFTSIVEQATRREQPVFLRRMLDECRLVGLGYVDRQELLSLNEELRASLTGNIDQRHTMRRAATWIALDQWLEALDL